MPRPLRLSSLAWPVFAALALASMAGCQDEGVRHYKVPRAQVVPPRLLGAIVPAGQKVWFIKLMGPTPAVAEQQGAFEQFVRSLRFNDDAKTPIAWTAPAGWQEQPGDQMSYAAFRAGTGGLKLTVTALDRAGNAASILANVNRWRGQVKLPPVAEGDLATTTRTFDVDGHAVTFVDLTAAGGEENPPPAIRDPQPAPPAAPKPLTYDVPPGWTELPANGFRVAAFRVSDGGRSAEVTVIPLAGQAGGLLANVNRWRKEVGLDDITETQLRKDAEPVTVGGATGFIVDLAGPESAGAGRKRTLGAILLHDGQSWFIKFMGPAELVGGQKAAFEAFVKSLHFAAGGKS